MDDFVEFIAKSLVDDPTQVEVREYRRGSQVIVNLRVAKEDMGRIIGRGGKVAGAIRTLLRVSAAQEGIRAILDISEPD